MAQVVDGLTVAVLGPLQVSVAGQPVELTAGRLRTLLVVLALSAGRTVSVDRMAAGLWGEEPPTNARRAIHTYVTRLRGAIGTDLIATEPSGYHLRVESNRVDALRLNHLLETATRTSDPATERDLLDEAIDLWRGDPFDGLDSDWLAGSEGPRLVERYLAAIERRTDLELANRGSVDRAGDLAAELRKLTVRYPLRESLWVRLMAVLDRGGRPAEALERYEIIRLRLAEELGTDPGPELRQAYAGLLAGRPLPQSAPAASVPRQLPADVDGFVGRADALKLLDAYADELDGRTARATVIAAIGGAAGVGKTTLAVHWAHRVAERFPDGQLYVNLRGFDASAPTMAAADAVRAFLEALDTPPQRMPSTVDAQVALYRSLMADRRMLILLDNARDAEQVRPLLPGSSSCLVLVTSRNRLTGLVAAEAARPVHLDLLSSDESRRMLARRLGADRLAAEPEATDDIVTRCARLPLALAVAAARAATHPHFSLSSIADQLRDALGALSGEEAATDVRAVFSWSYRALPEDAARLFRLLGLHPGPDVTVAAAADLAGVRRSRAAHLLGELTRVQLLTEHVPGRFAGHDLLRAYAAELAEPAESGPARQRLLDHYLQTSRAAAYLVNPHRDPITPTPPLPGIRPDRLGDSEQAFAWYAAEHAVLPAVLADAAATGFDRHAWQLAWSMEEVLFRRGYWQEWYASQQTALDAARRWGDRRAQALSLRSIANAAGRLGRYEDSLTYLEQALELFRALEDKVLQAHTHLAFSSALSPLGRLAEASGHRNQALALYAKSGDRLGQARVLNSNGWYHAEQGRYTAALVECRRALTLFQEVGERSGEAETWDSLGYAYHRLGDHAQAISCYSTAVAMFEEMNASYFLAEKLINLGDAYLAAQDPANARTVWRRALTIFQAAGQPEAHGVLDRLARLDQR